MVRGRLVLFAIGAVVAVAAPIQAQPASAPTAAPPAIIAAPRAPTTAPPAVIAVPPLTTDDRSSLSRAPSSATSQPAAEAAPPAAAPPAAAPSPAATPEAPSLEIILKKARTAGFKPELHDGVTLYCKKDDKADTGTHFIAPKRCYSEAQMLSLLDKSQQDRDWLRDVTRTNPTQK